MGRTVVYTRSIGKLLAEAAKGIAHPKYHVIYTMSCKWGVVKSGSSKVLRAFETVDEAVTFAKEKATKIPVEEIIVHKQDGTLNWRIAV
jgi:hypothetical protein